MLRGCAPPPLVVPSALVVVAGAGDGSGLTAAVNAAGGELRVTHALTVASARGVIETGAFECVLLGVGRPDAATVEVVHALRADAGSAALVVVVDDDDLLAPDLERLADLVLTPRDLAGDWLRMVRRCVEHTRTRTALRTAETSLARLSSIVESVADAVFTTDVDGIVTTWNAGAQQLYGYPATEVIGADLALLHPPGSDEPQRIIAMVRGGGTVEGHETVRRTRDGRIARVWMSVTPLRGEDGDLVGTVIVARHASDRLELEAELVRQTMNDSLTGLPNRAYLTYRLSQSLAEAKRHDRTVAALLVDLDQFRSIGDLHGHLIGDRVLAEVAGRLRALVRPTDLVARLGGDEFVVVCPGTDVQTAGRIAEQVLESVAAPIDVGRGEVRVGASVGIAVSAQGTDAESLIEQAEAAMQAAKARGRSGSEVFDPLLARRAEDRRLLVADLREALDRNQLDVWYQPVVDLASDRVVGLEALARWHHPTRGAVPPDTFVPLAEDHGFVAELDRLVLTRVCRDAAERRASGELPRELRVAVNLSARSLDDPGLVGMVAETTARSGLPPTALVLEITETALLENRDVARDSLEGLRALGAGVVLDDFGTGYSSLSFLRELPVTGVKIDRSFVRDAADRPGDLAITEAIVKLANSLSLETIAEGVETREQCDLLRDLGCRSAQGFWWSAAVPMTTITRTLAGGRAAAQAARAPRVHEAEAVKVAPALRPAKLPGPQAPEPAPGARVRTVCCLRGGIDAGQAWLVVSTPAQREAFARALGPLHAAAVARGQLVELDAYETLRKMAGADGRVDGSRFEHVVGPALRHLGATGAEVGVHVELAQVKQPLSSLQVSTDLRRRLHSMSRLTLAQAGHPADCAAHGPLPTEQLAVEDSTAS
jgi:diguanylate cyclase (GGDEF)-like protein/PAS domain S-box-containing protein